MSLLEGLLIVIVIVLIVLALKRSGPRGSTRREWDCVDRATGDTTTVRMQYLHGRGCKCPKCASPESGALKEHFAACTDLDNKQLLAEMCGEDDKFPYAVNEFGAPGMTYKDWVASQSVDTQVIKNHAEFVKDRLGNNTQNITGRTYSPDSHDSYDPIPWVGLRRPQAVAVCNPTQVSDVDYDLYSKNPTFTWKSS